MKKVGRKGANFGSKKSADRILGTTIAIIGPPTQIKMIIDYIGAVSAAATYSASEVRQRDFCTPLLTPPPKKNKVEERVRTKAKYEV